MLTRTGRQPDPGDDMLSRMTDQEFPASDPLGDLLANEARLRTLLTLAFDVSWEARLEGPGVGRLHVLQDLSAELGFPPGEIPRTLTAREWIARIHPDDIRSADQALDYVLNRQKPFREEYRVRRADGSYTWWEERGAPVEFENGRAVRWVGVIRNITERREAEEEL